MPTEPEKHLLDRDKSIELIKPVIEIASSLLREVINYSMMVYEKCRTCPKGRSDEAFPLLALYLHMIQMADSIEVLISNCCGTPANMQLRSSFEAKLFIEYMLEKDTHKREIAWLVKNIVDNINYLEKLDPSTPQGQKYREIFINEQFPEIIEGHKSINIPEEIGRLKAKLDKAEYFGVYGKYKALQKKNYRNPEWYSLDNGPKNLKQLAIHLQHGAEYETLYRSSSRMVHASSSEHLTLILDSRTSVLGPIRNPFSILHVAPSSISHLLTTTKLILHEFQTNRINHFNRWFQRDVFQRQLLLIKLEATELSRFDREILQK